MLAELATDLGTGKDGSSGRPNTALRRRRRPSRLALWSDVATWPDWNSDIERIEVSGPISVGRTIAMTPTGQDTVTLRITAVSEPHLFVDEAALGGAVVPHHAPDRPA